VSIEARNLSKSFGRFKAVDDVSFRLDEGVLAALLGPSGSGKSTLLRMISGLEAPDRGEIFIMGQDATRRAARERNVGFVFQHYALFKHMTVWQNIAFGLEARRRPKEEIRARVTDLLRLVQMEGMEKRYPSQLSGGQRQRVALARALAPQPRVLLLDEPFGALDAKVREELRGWLRQLHEHSRVTTLFVTHDQREALEIADKILVLDKGRLEQQGTPREIFDKPATPFVAQFVGENNFIDAEVTEPELVCWGPFRFEVGESLAVGRKVRLFFRPYDVYVSNKLVTLQVRANIVTSRFRGPVMELVLDVGGDKRVTAQVPKGIVEARGFSAGRDVFVGITAYHVFPQ